MRSPNYPLLSLPQAIDAIKSIYREHQRGAVTDVEVATAMGYTGLNGLARSKISALKKYGFLAPQANAWRLTDRAMQIIHKPSESPEHQKSLRDAVASVDLFRQLFETHADASEAALKAHLVADLDFTSEGADRAAKSFLETKAVIVLSDDDTISESSSNRMPSERSESAFPMVATATNHQTQINAQVKQEMFAVERGQIVVQWPIGMNADEVNDACEWLDLIQKKIVRSIRGPTDPASETG